MSSEHTTPTTSPRTPPPTTTTTPPTPTTTATQTDSTAMPPPQPVQLTHEESCTADECAICLDEFDDSNPAQNTTCSHKFHFQCILQWQERSNCCPLCYKPFAMEGEDVPTQARLPASPLNYGRLPPPTRTPQGIPVDLLEEMFLMSPQLSELFGVPPSRQQTRSTPQRTQPPQRSASASAPSSSHRDRSRSYHIEASSRTSRADISPTASRASHHHHSPFSKLRSALSDMVGRSRRLRVSHTRDHLSPHSEASSSRSPSASPNRSRGASNASSPRISSTSSPVSLPVTPPSILAAELDSSSPLNLNASTSSSSLTRVNSPPNLNQLAAPDYDQNTVMAFLNKSNPNTTKSDAPNSAPTNTDEAASSSAAPQSLECE